MLVLTLGAEAQVAAPSAEDGFAPNVTGTVHALAVQSDGKMLLGGAFSVDYVQVGGIARLNIDGSRDTTFDSGTGADSIVYALAQQEDGKVVVGGAFTSINGTVRNRIARLTSDGSLDIAFDPSADGDVDALAVQSDDKVIIAGSFANVNGTACNRIARLNTDGSLDTSFNPGTGADGGVNALALQPDGKIMLSGIFSAIDGISRNGIARLNADGSLDPTFQPGTGANNVLALSVQPDGMVLVGGTFTSINGTARNFIARLNSDGSVDATFDPGTGANNSVYALALQADGKILLGGTFSEIDGTPRDRVARLLPDGSLDNEFYCGDLTAGVGVAGFAPVNVVAIQTDGRALVGGRLSFYSYLGRLNTDGSLDKSLQSGPAFDESAAALALALQPDGKVLIGGQFTKINNATRYMVARLDVDGSLDTTFEPAPGADSVVYALAVQTDGKILLGGSFGSVNTVIHPGVARLNADGSVDTTFDAGTVGYSVRALALQSDGKILLGGDFTTINGTIRNRIARLNADGSLDLTFDPGTGADGLVNAVVVQADGKVLLGGAFSSINGTGRNAIARLNADGSIDMTFDPGTGANDAVQAISVQTDGKILLGGDFTIVLGASLKRIARLNADGSLDGTFGYSGSGADVNSVYALAIQADGKILLGGNFTSVNGSGLEYVARLDANGIVDPTFSPGTFDWPAVYALAVQADGKAVLGGGFRGINERARNPIARLNTDGSLDGYHQGPGANDFVHAVAVEPDGGILLGGVFTRIDGSARNRIARLTCDGSLDVAFDPGLGANGAVYAVGAPVNGKVLLGGEFSTIDGVARNGIARLSGDGSVDTTFDPGAGADGPVHSLAMLEDGKVLLGGEFTVIDGTARNGIARLNADGSVDETFDPGTGADDSVYALAVQPDGKVLLGGEFTAIDGTAAGRLARLNADGGLDTTFDPGTGADGAVRALALLGDGMVLVGGSFTGVNGVTRRGVARLDDTGVVDLTFDPGSNINGSVRALAIQMDGSVLLGGSFYTSVFMVENLIRLSSDGSLDTAFDFQGTGVNAEVSALAMQSDGRILLGGRLTSIRSVGRHHYARLSNPDAAQQVLSVDTGSASVTWQLGDGYPQPYRVHFEESADGATWTAIGWGVWVPGAGYRLTGLRFPVDANHYIRATGWNSDSRSISQSTVRFFVRSAPTSVGSYPLYR